LVHTRVCAAALLEENERIVRKPGRRKQAKKRGRKGFRSVKKTKNKKRSDEKGFGR